MHCLHTNTQASEASVTRPVCTPTYRTRRYLRHALPVHEILPWVAWSLFLLRVGTPTYDKKRYIRSRSSCPLTSLSSYKRYNKQSQIIHSYLQIQDSQTRKHHHKMHFPASFVLFSLLALLVSDVFADTYYRGDSRTPSKIKSEGGFKSKGSNMDLFKHVEEKDKTDGYVSTSSDIDAAKNIGVAKYVYTLDSTKITEKIHDVAAEYKAANKEYPHPNEKEFAVEREIPWDAVTAIVKKDGKDWTPVDKPSKRAPDFFPNESVSADGENDESEG